ncbi:CYTH domain-containing protein [Natranaerovirga pectinivora]|uniref:CYTH domain-containing protein n=1 Tax=Natranaerovirga pectinivora TaxID=682400 RepID=A0A4R3MER8_9FIRM|nr:CYTH domain-containing protein [Natranaerovirga pectinivora]TCT12150.1 CYTH domain-containing protein [Natranaerovirga pectinivora]
MEIERKYLINNLDTVGNLSLLKYDVIEQGYLCTEPVIRIRKQSQDYYLTYKSKGLLQREEINEKISDKTYSHLKEKIDFNLIEKTRYYIPFDNGLVGELDVFEGKLKGLMVIEVEFKSLDEADEFVPPEWFGREVTFEGAFQNNQLVRLESLSGLFL